MEAVAECDVAIIGGGPAGSTVGSLLKKYNSSLRVLIFERELFPRDHIGESQLPAISPILDEMGVWDEVEVANFPIKVGATYRWGSTTGLWKLEFLVGKEFQEEKRPAKFAGQRLETAFQVDRSIYDKILLDHTRKLGCEVYEQVKVDDVEVEGDRVSRLRLSPRDSMVLKGSALEGATHVSARYTVDASGGSAILRKKLGIGVSSPTNLRNLAFWDYWQDADWAESVGNGGTRIQVLSLTWGWIWFIPISPTRTSIGLVVPAETYKASGQKPEAMYLEAVHSEPRVARLIARATREGGFQTTNDWSTLSDRIAGENWFLAGDSCGFADPILSAGMTLAHTSGRRVAYSILELDHGTLDPNWIKEEYDRNHRHQIGHHIRFADFWYSSNGCFTDLKANCADIAKHAGLELTAQSAFHWLSTGGFAGEDYAFARQGTFRFNMVRKLTESFTNETLDWNLSKYNEFRLNLVGAVRGEITIMHDGRIEAAKCYRRKGKTLPIHGIYRVVYSSLARESDGLTLLHAIRHGLHAHGYSIDEQGMFLAYEVLESMIVEAWVSARLNKKRPLMFAESESSAMGAS